MAARSRETWIAAALLVAGLGAATPAASEPTPAAGKGFAYPAAPARQQPEQAQAKSAGCLSCHLETDQPTMHANDVVVLGCVDCHGGNAAVIRHEAAAPGSHTYEDAKRSAHVQSILPQDRKGPAIPERSFTQLNQESPAYVRFVNPSDLRVAREACGACHLETVENVERSLMAHMAMFWGGAAYNNGVLPFKRYIVGEAYTRDGEPAALVSPPDFELTPEHVESGVIPSVVPLPRWETLPPADNFRIFERGGRNIGSLFPEIGLPNPAEEPGKPDNRQSNRGPGTGARISVPVLNIHKTRLNDPGLWFAGTRDNPGDFRASGCAACHVVYANDRSETSAGSYAEHGHWGQSISKDPTINTRLGADGEKEHGHPLRHEFTRAIPSSQCMTCHHHQPNIFVNSYLGFTMWDYESDAPLMWPKEQKYPSIPEMRKILDRNPEEAAIRGKWGDPEFMGRVTDDINPEARDTQFADYHGHGWNFRAVYKRSRDGTLLDDAGEPVPDDLSSDEKWRRAVHMKDIHADAGMQCTDCHFSQDNHGNGMLYGEVAAAIEIRCADCHGTADRHATLLTSGPAAPPGGNDLRLARNEDGRRRFVWRDGALYQRQTLPPHKEHAISQVKDSVTPEHPAYNPKAARAKTVVKGGSGAWGEAGAGCARAHDEGEISCYSCHTAWATSCGGCHLPIQANWKTERHHFEGGETRNFATYNPQVARDQMFQLGRHGEAKDGIIAPIRSSSALVLSSQDINRNKIYIQQPPVSAGGYSSQAFAPHFPHTVRKTETKQCSDCHVSNANDNNAIMAQLLLLGTNFVNFVGFNAWVGTETSIQAVQVTEWDEPQAVIGSYLHRYAYPDWFEQHEQRGLELRQLSQGIQDADPKWFARIRDQLRRPFLGKKHQIDDGAYGHHAGTVGCLQLRGEYLYVAQGTNGMQAYDVANIANKGFSERIITAPFSPLGHDTHIASKNATCVALPTNQPIRPERNREELATTVNLEQPMHPIYSYAAITDAEEGLILVNIETLADFEPRNNFFDRALTWNPDGVLDGAVFAHFAGHHLYVSAARGIVVIDLDDPLTPRVVSTIPLAAPRASVVQFRYLFATDAEGLKVVDVTHPERPRIIDAATVPFADARRVFVARTYAYVAAGADGLVIVDIEKPEAPKELMRYTADGQLNDAQDVIVATTNASLFAYVADGANGLKVLQLTSPDLQPKFYGFSPQPNPQLIAWRETDSPALSLSRPLERDRGVDETGHQIAVFGRIGSRPFNLEEMQRLYLNEDGTVWTVDNAATEPPEGAVCAEP